MKVNGFLFFISLVLGGLIFYGFHQWSDGGWLFSLGTALICSAMLVCTIAVTPDKETVRSGAMIKVFSGAAFVLTLLLDIVLAMCNASDTFFIIANGVGLCVWATSIYLLGKTKQ